MLCCSTESGVCGRERNGAPSCDCFFCLVFLAVASHFTARVAFDGDAKQACVVCVAKFGRAVC